MPGTRHTGPLAHTGLRRPQRAVSLMLSAGLLALTVAGVPADAREALLPSLQDGEFARLIQQGLARHPSVFLAGIAALAVPVVAVIAASSRFAAKWRRRRAGGTGAIAPPIAYRSAWIEVSGRPASPVTVGEMLRIGDSDECDLAVPGVVPGGTCALIQRTSDCEFILFDVSAGEERLAVNGTALASCRLADGDRIEIGGARLVFRTGDAIAAAGLEQRA